MCVGVQILGDSPPFTVGSTATLSCVSDSDANMIEWFDGSVTRVDMTTTGRSLDLVLNPVRDDLHQTTFTCRVTRANGVVEQNITLSVAGENLVLAYMSTVAYKCQTVPSILLIYPVCPGVSELLYI